MNRADPPSVSASLAASVQAEMFDCSSSISSALVEQGWGCLTLSEGSPGREDAEHVHDWLQPFQPLEPQRETEPKHTPGRTCKIELVELRV